MTETTVQIPPAGAAGLPHRVVARMRRDIPLVLLDALIVVPAYFIPLVLRFHGVVPSDRWTYFWLLLPGIVLIHLLCNYLYGLYGQMWRYASMQEARCVLLSGITSFVCVLALVEFVGHGRRPLPLSVIALGSAGAVALSGAIRFQSRLFAFRRRSVGTRTRVLVMGAGEAGAQVLHDILEHPEVGLEIVGILDDDPQPAGTDRSRCAGAGRPCRDPATGQAARRGAGLAGHTECHQ